MRFVTLLVALMVILAAAGAVAYYGVREAHRPYKNYSDEEVFLTISPGQSSSAIARELRAKGIIRDERLFRLALWVRRAAERLQAGEYRFSEPASAVTVIDRLVRGDVYYLSVTVPEGLTLLETAILLEGKTLGEEEDFIEAFGKAELIASLDPEATDLEGYLYPETYRLPRKPPAEDVARAMVDRFIGVFDASRREKAEELDLTVRELVTFASIVEKETGLAEERPLIASVFWNRMRKGMALQSDPTIIYELKRQGNFDGNLRRADLERDTPYNTYLNRGLPPGPIASPGRDALDAVLYPVETDYFYFVSKNDGSHHFSKTLREHSAAVRKYQIEYFRNSRRQRKKGSDSS